jgi:predicted ArsR family transcriptional regulator
MQETRRTILKILRERGEATVDDIVHDLEVIRGSITAVTVRHHLTKLQDSGLVLIPEMRHRSSPGRPQHLYALSEQGSSQFPNNYQSLAVGLLEQMKTHLPESQINVIIEGIADHMADSAYIPTGPMRLRLDAVVDYLNLHGYKATWDVTGNGYLLSTANCPYHQLVDDEHDHLCQMDIRLISQMLGTVPRLQKNIAENDVVCEYFIPDRT